MLPYCLRCRKNTENVDPKVSKIKNGRTILPSKWAVCSSQKSRFMKEQEAIRLLTSLCIETPLSNIPLLGKILL